MVAYQLPGLYVPMLLSMVMAMMMDPTGEAMYTDTINHQYSAHVTFPHNLYI